MDVFDEVQELDSKCTTICHAIRLWMGRCWEALDPHNYSNGRYVTNVNQYVVKIRGKFAIRLFLLKSNREEQFMMDSRKFPTFHVMPEGCLANEDTWRKLVSDGLKDRQAWQNVAKANCSPKSISTVLENMSTPVAKEDGSKQPQPGYQMGYPTTGQ